VRASSHSAFSAAGAAHRHAGATHPNPVIVKMPTTRVLAGLRIRHDDFGIYQGNRRYADIVAGRASNAQDARIFAI